MAGNCEQGETVEMHLAWMWDCPTCGRENFERSVSYELDDKDDEAQSAARQMLGLGEWQEVPDGALQTYPLQVHCKHCSRAYQTDPVAA